MNVRHRLEKSSGTKYSDANISPEMKSLNKKFGIAHGMNPISTSSDRRHLKLIKPRILHRSTCSDSVHCRCPLRKPSIPEYTFMNAFISPGYLYTLIPTHIDHPDSDSTHSHPFGLDCFLRDHHNLPFDHVHDLHGLDPVDHSLLDRNAQS